MAYISGTTASAGGYSTEVAYPAGFSNSNCYVASLSINAYGNYRTGDHIIDEDSRFFAEETSTGVKVYTTNVSSFNSKSWKALLIKL